MMAVENVLANSVIGIHHLGKKFATSVPSRCGETTCDMSIAHR
jgi:hypothetical protein